MINVPYRLTLHSNKMNERPVLRYFSGKLSYFVSLSVAKLNVPISLVFVPIAKRENCGRNGSVICISCVSKWLDFLVLFTIHIQIVRQELFTELALIQKILGECFTIFTDTNKIGCCGLVVKQSVVHHRLFIIIVVVG